MTQERHIVLVPSMDLIGRGMESCFRQEGYEVSRFHGSLFYSSGNDAFDRLEKLYDEGKKNVVLVVTIQAITVHPVDGVDSLKVARKKHPGISIIVIKDGKPFMTKTEEVKAALASTDSMIDFARPNGHGDEIVFAAEVMDQVFAHEVMPAVRKMFEAMESRAGGKPDTKALKQFHDGNTR